MTLYILGTITGVVVVILCIIIAGITREGITNKMTLDSVSGFYKELFEHWDDRNYLHRSTNVQLRSIVAILTEKRMIDENNNDNPALSASDMESVVGGE